MVRIYLRAGHGGDHIGASGHGLVEKQETLRHILSVARLMEGYDGAEMKLARTDDSTVPLSVSIGQANTWGADIYYSAHHNGFSDSRARGYESYIFTAPSADSIRAQNIIHPLQAAVWTKWGSVDRGKKRANFAELRLTNMAAILIENGFLTNPGDAALLNNQLFYTELDSATVRGFVALYGLKLKKNQAGLAERYIAQPGDNLYRIARNHHLTLEDLARMNPHIDDTSVLETGDVIFLTPPGEFEVEFAVINRELIRSKKKLAEYRETGWQIHLLSLKFEK